VAGEGKSAGGSNFNLNSPQPVMLKFCKVSLCWVPAVATLKTAGFSHFNGELEFGDETLLPIGGGISSYWVTKLSFSYAPVSSSLVHQRRSGTTALHGGKERTSVACL
jgi:hypothetical protein